jgi:hypothetical protein
VQNINSSFRTLRELVCILALAVFVCRALIPVGFMPDMQAGAGSFMTICSGYGDGTRDIETDGTPLKAKPPCEFSINAGGVEPFLKHVYLPILYAINLIHVFVITAAPAQYNAQPYPSRAPPSA